MAVTLMICAAFWIIYSLITSTKNFASSLFFKVLPFLSGVVTALCAMDLLGWVNIFGGN